MRVLFLTNFYPPYDLGGWEQICQETVARLRARGHVCHVLTSRYGVQGWLQPEEGVTRALHLQADIHYYRPLNFFLRRPWQERANQRALRRVVDDFQPDVVFIWGMWNLSPSVAYWSEQWMPERVAYNIEGYWPMEPDFHRAYWGAARRSLAAHILLWPVAQLARGILATERYRSRLRLSHVSCCSQYVVDVLTNSGAIPPGAVAILNGIDPAPFFAHARRGPGQGATLRLLYFGGLAEHKGVHTAIEALGLLQRRGQTDGLQLTVVGAGHPKYEAYLRGLTRSLALEDKVRFVGRVPRSEIPEVLENHDVFLFTSIYAEPFGRTIIEAMAAGLAVIGSDVGGSREIFNFYPEDMLFEPGNVDAMASQIRRFADDPGLIERLSVAGQKLVLERFTLDRMVDEMEAFLRELI